MSHARSSTEETKDAFAESAETIKQVVGQIQEAEPSSQLLSLALLLHAAVGLFFSTTLYFNPKRLIPGFVKDVSWTNSLAAGPGAVLHLFALKGIGMAVVAGLAAVGYDAKHKAMLNAALLIYHLSILAEVMSKRSNFDGFMIPPHVMHLPLALVHGLALAAYSRPDLFGGAKRKPMAEKQL